MANGRNRGRKSDSGRDAGGFIALPWSVMDCAAYQQLSHPARSLLMEVARQFVRDNNGRLLLSATYLSQRGWKSADVITRAKRELLQAGFIHETVRGQRPNKASWYAVTWRSLDRIAGYDAGATELFCRGAYQRHTPALQNKVLKPRGGLAPIAIAPSHGVENYPTTPSRGAMQALSTALPTPSAGNHLEMPSAMHKVQGSPSTPKSLQAHRSTV